ncbi:sensor histidine kinase [Saccharobesus litoralis]|uniref:sensor histidine kinase n=1 Tax=Saccharobesus litoralis TaxID=2172099 RepID=UPI00131EE253|nr:HAMP domain-containing sensor histidine kinase [Saccharobesus litoralis]
MCLFIGFKFVHFHFQLAQQQAVQLSEFTRRSITRLEANPNKFIGDNPVKLGNRKMQLVAGYDQLKQYVPYIPEQLTKLEKNKVSMVLDSFNGLFAIANFSIVYPVVFQGQDYFAFFRYKPDFNDEHLEAELAQSLQPVIFTSAFIIALLFFVQLIYTYKMDNNVRELADWAQNLSMKNQPQAPPQMRVQGLNPLATMVNNSLQAFNTVLEKEHSFARFTSHELRTQVAILSANMEILDAIMADLRPSERKVLFRMEQVVSDMKYQTEALLWISKQAEKDIEFSDCQLRKMIDKSVTDNQPLLLDKPVSIEIVGADQVISSHPTLLQIALNNLIRNAVQNTHQGKIVISLDNHSLTILNQDMTQDEQANSTEGFGIGLVIVEKIVERLKLSYQVEPLNNGRWVKLVW